LCKRKRRFEPDVQKRLRFLLSLLYMQMAGFVKGYSKMNNNYFLKKHKMENVVLIGCMLYSKMNMRKK